MSVLGESEFSIVFSWLICQIDYDNIDIFIFDFIVPLNDFVSDDNDNCYNSNNNNNINNNNNNNNNSVMIIIVIMIITMTIITTMIKIMILIILIIMIITIIIIIIMIIITIKTFRKFTKINHNFHFLRITKGKIWRKRRFFERIEHRSWNFLIRWIERI